MRISDWSSDVCSSDLDGEAGTRRYIDDQIVEVASYTSGNTDIGPQIAKLQAAKVDLVIGFNVPSYTALSQLTALKLNFKTQWFYSNVGSDPTLVGSLLAKFSEGAVKAGSSLLDGVMTTEDLAGGDQPDDPWAKPWTKGWNESGGAG